MAKMFYTVDEVKTMLGLDDSAIRALIQQDKLRELHDGPRRVFKADQVEALAAAQASSKRPAPPDTDAGGFALEMADSTAAGASDTGRADTALGADEDQLALADTETPSSAAGTGGSDQDVLQLDGSGSGSGLLDLTREGDDTSLGAVLDEIYPSEEDTTAGLSGLGSGIAAGLGTGLASALTPEAAEPQADRGPAVDAAQLAQDRIVRATRPFIVGMFLAVALLALALSAVAAVLQGIMPGYLVFVCQNLLYFLIASVVAALVVFVLGAVLSK